MVESAPKELVCARFAVHGRVQGVGYRYAAQRRAHALKLTGYVRNCADGSVEVVAVGAAAALLEMERWLGEGPAHAQVQSVVRLAHGECDFRDFTIR